MQGRFRVLFDRVMVNVPNGEDHDEDAHNHNQDCKPIKAWFSPHRVYLKVYRYRNSHGLPNDEMNVSAGLRLVHRFICSTCGESVTINNTAH